MPKLEADPSATLEVNGDLPSAVGSRHALSDFLSILADVDKVIPPVWPLADYVAVNPFLGVTDRKFLDAQEWLRNVRECDLIMPMTYFRSLWHHGQFSRGDIDKSLQQCRSEYPEWFADLETTDIVDVLASEPSIDAENRRSFRTVSEVVDGLLRTNWTGHITNDVSRHCSAHFDLGQSMWESPWKGQTLYKSWKAAASVSRRMDCLGMRGFHRIVVELPDDPAAAVIHLLLKLPVPPKYWKNFLICELMSISGWASFIKYKVRQSAFAGAENNDLVGIMAIRLAYDVALAQAPGITQPTGLCPDDEVEVDENTESPQPSRSVLVRYALQVAAESAYRSSLYRRLSARESTDCPDARRSAQLVFCIDVRSEIIRRHLEAVNPSLETFGFAGFFGLPVEYVPLGESEGIAQCPVLINPILRVDESIHGCGPEAIVTALRKEGERKHLRKSWKIFQSSAVSCFSFVESVGLGYFARLLTDSMGWTRPEGNFGARRVTTQQKGGLGPDLAPGRDSSLSLDTRVRLAQGILRNLGLVSDFARIVVFCGHAADVVNNPYRSGLDCGACGGHSGEPNARIAAALMNDSEVRHALQSSGITIPHDTWFMAALHNTTTDEIQFFDQESLPPSHKEDFATLSNASAEAGRRARAERTRRLRPDDVSDLMRRSRDWSETRPEWGLAGNAAFVIAPRHRTIGVDLGGRVFMHSYDPNSDPDRSVLELIMTAPMIVTNWINMQYYASTVDPQSFGSGNKVIHNIVGQLGVFEGNGGDLKVGLPLQSVHDGKQWQHEPLRLLVVIEATRDAVGSIVKKHSLVRDLASNGWITLVAWEQETFYRWDSQCSWQEEYLCN